MATIEGTVGTNALTFAAERKQFRFVAGTVEQISENQTSENKICPNSGKMAVRI